LARVPDIKQIKSAERVLALLGFFNASRREATVMDIVRAYGYPQSSTSELLGCLVELGFLRRDRYKRTYRPTAKVAMLGAWTCPNLFRHGNLFGMMDVLAEETGCSVVLAGTVGVRYEYIHTVLGTSALQTEDEPGILTKGPVGRLFLSAYDRSQVRKIVHRLNSEVDEMERVRCDDLLLELDQISKQGFAASACLAEGRGGIIAMRLPQYATDDDLALGLVVGCDDTRGSAFHLRALNNAVKSSIEQPVIPIRDHGRTSLRPAS